MRLFGILNLLFFCTLAGAAEKAAKRTAPANKPLKPIPVEKVAPVPPEASPPPEADSIADSDKPAWYVNGRGGWLSKAADADVQDKWDHDIFSSYIFSVGVHRLFPRSWKQIFFFAGADFSYLNSEEEISSGLSNSYLTTTSTQLMATGGLSWFPGSGPWGFSFFTSFIVWGEMETKLEAEGFSKSLGKSKPNEHNDSLLPLLGSIGVTGEYRWSETLRPFICYEIRNGNPITFGVNYGF